MQTEVIVLHILRVILFIATAIKSYLIWKYINKKALGMQTILDQMVKDIIIIHGISFIFGEIALIKIFEKPYNHYVALTILMGRYYFGLGIFWQIFVIVVVRYLSVFYHSMLNSVDEINVIMTTRLFVGFMCLISTLLDCYVNGYERQYIYISLTNMDIDPELISAFKCMQFAVVVDIIVLVMVQIRIEIFKKPTNIPVVTEDEENPNCLETTFEYSNNTIRTLLFIMCVILFCLLAFLLLVLPKINNLNLSRLRFTVFTQILLTNLIPLIFIKRNPNMYKYCFKQIQCLLSPKNSVQPSSSNTKPRLSSAQ